MTWKWENYKFGIFNYLFFILLLMLHFDGGHEHEVVFKDKMYIFVQWTNYIIKLMLIAEWNSI